MIPLFEGVGLCVGPEVQARSARSSSDSRRRSEPLHASVRAFRMQLRLAARSLVPSPVCDSRDIGDIFPSAADEGPCRCPHRCRSPAPPKLDRSSLEALGRPERERSGGNTLNLAQLGEPSVRRTSCFRHSPSEPENSLQVQLPTPPIAGLHPAVRILEIRELASFVVPQEFVVKVDGRRTENEPLREWSGQVEVGAGL